MPEITNATQLSRAIHTNLITTTVIPTQLHTGEPYDKDGTYFNDTDFITPGIELLTLRRDRDYPNQNRVYDFELRDRHGPHHASPLFTKLRQAAITAAERARFR